MRTRFGMMFAGVALAVAAFGALSPVGSVSAEEPETAGEVDVAYFYGDDAAMPRWGRYSIVYCAAETMGIEVDAVKGGLREGHSLKEIGIRVGVRPVVLENGILRCEHSLLQRLVTAGELEPHEARRIMNFLETHITRIINYHWTGAS